jgi:hypothetical protein
MYKQWLKEAKSKVIQQVTCVGEGLDLNISYSTPEP